MPHHDRLNIAVFIDFDNIEIGVKSTLGQQFDVGTILDAIKERGEVVTKIAYADWTRAGEYSRTLTQHAIRLVQRNLTPGGDKNGADINLALDALEMAFTHPHINAYVIVGGDSDFLSLVEKLKQYDKKVFVVGGRAFTSVILQRNCHEFIAYENLHGVRKTAAKIGRPMPAAAANSPIAQAFSIVRRALKILADREVSPQTGLLKSTLLQLDSTFSERNYGASSFLDFVEKLSQAGLVQLKHAGRSVMVELNNQFDETEAGAAEKARAAAGVDAIAEPSGVMPPPSPGSGYGEPRRSDGGGGPRPADHTGVAQPPSPGSVYGEPRRSDSGGGAFRPAQEQPAPEVAASHGTARRRRQTRGGCPQRRDHGAMADVPAQRQATAARSGQRVRRTALRFLGPGRARPRLSEGRAGPPRTRPARRAACVSGSGAAARRRGGRASRGADGASERQRSDRGRTADDRSSVRRGKQKPQPPPNHRRPATPTCWTTSRCRPAIRRRNCSARAHGGNGSPVFPRRQPARRAAPKTAARKPAAAAAAQAASEEEPPSRRGDSGPCKAGGPGTAGRQSAHLPDVTCQPAPPALPAWVQIYGFSLARKSTHCWTSACLGPSAFAYSAA